MATVRSLLQPSADLVALEANVARAGMALACSFSSSDEYEAAIIQERREAGAYDAGRAQRVIVLGVLGAVAIALFVYVVG
jgi:hypothetical protein